LVLSSPAVYDNKVYIGSYDGMFYCFDATDGDELWKISTGQVWSSPAIYDDKVIVGSFNGVVYCLNASSGNEIWANQTTTEVIVSTPTVYNGRIYIGSNDFCLYCLDITDGDTLWKVQTVGQIHSSAAAFGEKVYFGGGTRVYCLDALSGNVTWDFTTGGQVRSSPAIADGKVYIGSQDQKVYCLDANDGSKIWEYVTGHRIDASPAIYEGKLYIGSLDSKVYCFEDIPDTNQPPVQPSKPVGSIEGRAGEEISFSTGSIDPDGDSVYYKWDWADEISGWLGPYDSGETIEAKHIWTEQGIYNIKVKSKDIYEEESSWSPEVGITVTPPLPKLQIDAPSSVIEGSSFLVIITSDYLPVENATVIFLEEMFQADANGFVTFTAPLVDVNTDYNITANKSGYQNDTAVITVLNQDVQEGDGGWTFGIVTDNLGIPLDEVSVCVIDPDTGSARCIITDDQGKYNILVPADTYTVRANKEGYITITKIDIVVQSYSAIEVNFILDEGQKIGEVTESHPIDFAIEYGINEGIISGEITIFSEEESQSIVYDNRLVIEVDSTTEEDKVGFTIAGLDGTPGTVVALRINNPKYMLNSNSLDLNDIVVEYDGEHIDMATDFGAIFDPSDDSKATWIGLITGEIFYLLVFFPEFSEHSITIYTVAEAISGITAIIFYVAICVIAGIVFLSHALSGPVIRFTIKRKK